MLLYFLISYLLCLVKFLLCVNNNNNNNNNIQRKIKRLDTKEGQSKSIICYENCKQFQKYKYLNSISHSLRHCLFIRC